MRTRRWLILGAVLVVLRACTLNPQPEPPSGASGADAAVGLGGSAGGGMGGSGASGGSGGANGGAAGSAGSSSGGSFNQDADANGDVEPIPEGGDAADGEAPDAELDGGVEAGDAVAAD